MFKVSLFVSNHFDTFLSSLFNVWLYTDIRIRQECISTICKRKNDNISEHFYLWVSFVWIKKSSGPRTEPCGTPQVIIFFNQYGII